MRVPIKKAPSVAALSVAGVIAGLAITAGSPAPANKTTTPAATAKPQPATRVTPPPAEFAIDSPTDTARTAMRQVWAEHVVYTRQYIISAIGGLSDAHVVSTRLLENADAIGAMLRPYYGDNISKKLSILMRDQVMILADLAQTASGQSTSATGAYGNNGRATDPKSVNRTGGVVAPKDIDKDQLSVLQRRLENNGKNIAAFLNSANPVWRLSDFEGLMQANVDQTIGQITARANGDWESDMRAFDQALDDVFRIADALSRGIERQFPAERSAQVN